jgi:hypothetical protein
MSGLLHDINERHYYYDGYCLCMDHAPTPAFVAEGEILIVSVRDKFLIARALGSSVICDKCREPVSY